MARKMKKFSAGGAQGRYERRMADIEKDRKIALAKGKNSDVAEAKAAQRIADAKDDLAKRTGADRTATRAAERAAESNLTKTRKYGAPQAVAKDTTADMGSATKSLGAITAPKADSSIGKPQSFGAAFKEARARLGAGKTFTYNGKSFTTNIAGEGKKPASRTNTGASSSTARTNTSAKPPVSTTKAPATVAQPVMAAAPTNKGLSGAEYERALKTGRIPGNASAEDRANLMATIKAKQNAAYARPAKLAKGGAVKKENIMKKKSTPPQPTAAERAADAKFRASVKDLKVTPENAAAIGRGNRSTGYKKGGKMATKFGAAMVKKSADTKGRAMVKKCSGGSMKKYASGGLVAGHKSADGIAKKGKTRGKMPTMKKGGYC